MNWNQLNDLCKSKNKINVLGPPGSGKTTLSIKLSQYLKSELIVLDKILFNENCELKVDRSVHFINSLKSKNKCIIDGTYVSLLSDERIQIIDHFIMIDCNIFVSFYRIIKRNFQKKKLNCGERFSPKLVKFLIEYHLHKKNRIINMIPNDKLIIIKYDIFK